MNSKAAMYSEVDFIVSKFGTKIRNVLIENDKAVKLLSIKSDESGKRDSVPLSGRLSFLSACGRPQAPATYPKDSDEQPFRPGGLHLLTWSCSP